MVDILGQSAVLFCKKHVEHGILVLSVYWYRIGHLLLEERAFCKFSAGPIVVPNWPSTILVLKNFNPFEIGGMQSQAETGSAQESPIAADVLYWAFASLGVSPGLAHQGSFLISNTCTSTRSKILLVRIPLDAECRYFYLSFKPLFCIIVIFFLSRGRLAVSRPAEAEKDST